MSELDAMEKRVRVPMCAKVLTAAYAVGVIIYSAWFWPSDGLRPNELGDLLAGAAAPLAFFWFVITVFMQTKELEYQRRELIQSREATEKLANEARSQTNLSRQNVDAVLCQFLEANVQRQLDEMLDSLIWILGRFKIAFGLSYGSSAQDKLEDLWQRRSYADLWGKIGKELEKLPGQLSERIRENKALSLRETDKIALVRAANAQIKYFEKVADRSERIPEYASIHFSSDQILTRLREVRDELEKSQVAG